MPADIEDLIEPLERRQRRQRSPVRGVLPGARTDNRRPVANDPGNRLGGAAQLSERGVVGSGRQRVSTAGSAVPAELRGRKLLESGFQRLQAAWPGLGRDADARCTGHRVGTSRPKDVECAIGSLKRCWPNSMIS